MAKALTAKQCAARFQALDEAAEHLEQAWTDDSTEREEGLAMATWLRAQARTWLEKAELRASAGDTTNEFQLPAHLSDCACGEKPIGHRSAGQWIIRCSRPGCPATTIQTSRENAVESWNTMATKKLHR